MTFTHAVDSCPHLTRHFREGLGALGSNRSRVEIQDTRMIRGSLNVEAAQQAVSRQEHVDVILNKLQSLKAFLHNYAMELEGLPARFVWLATAGVRIAPQSREKRRLNGKGVLLKSSQTY